MGYDKAYEENVMAHGMQLLEALSDLLGECQVWITTSLMNHTDWKQYVAVRTAAEAAIKKARGEQ